jgi:molecular chaperone DnaJ
VVRVRPDEFFQRHGQDVVCEMPITMPTAALGGEVELPTLDGKAHLKIPAGTQSGKVFRLRGKGLPPLRGSGRGDQLVQVMVETPTHLTPAQRTLLEEFAHVSHQENTPRLHSFLERMRRWLER